MRPHSFTVLLILLSLFVVSTIGITISIKQASVPIVFGVECFSNVTTTLSDVDLGPNGAHVDLERFFREAGGEFLYPRRIVGRFPWLKVMHGIQRATWTPQILDSTENIVEGLICTICM